MADPLALGLMSGTSADGVSLALARVGTRSLRVLAHATYAYPGALRRRILAAPGASLAEVSDLNFDLGRAFAGAARRFLRAQGVRAASLAAAGSHGQTLLHRPEGRNPSTLQVGEPSFLAEALGVPVVSDFRPRDMAAGGEGAPLAPFLDEFLFGEGPARALQNVGGIGNVALVGRGVKTLGFDTGPGNCLMDAAMRRITGGRESFDRDGRLAAQGKADDDLLARLLRAPFFARRPPKSLDRSAFAEAFLEKHFGRTLRARPADALATLTRFTALTIADAYRRFLLPRAALREAVISGGGALNPVLMRELAAALRPLPVRSIAEHGVPPLAKEPALMALLAVRAVHGRSNHCPAATGATGRRILGKITPSPRS